MNGRPLAQRLWYEFAQHMVRVFVSVMFRARYSGHENVPRSGGVLLVCNHQSHLDPPLVGAGCPRQMVYLARSTLFLFRPFGWLIHSFGAIPIDRERSALGGIRATLHWLQQGEMVLVFPEGTRSRDGELGVFKPGMALVARRAKVPVLPTAIDGAYDAWPRSASLPRPGEVHVHFGPPLWPDETEALDEQQLGQEVERRVRDCFALLRRRRESARP